MLNIRITFDCSSCEAIAQMAKQRVITVKATFDRAVHMKPNPIVADSA